MSIVLIMSLYLVSADFPICTANRNQYYPRPAFENGQYYVFWADYRNYPIDTTYCIYGARIALDGTVLDPDGKVLFKRSAAYRPATAFDGSNFLVVFRDGC